ncbi:MAG: class I SAM-dependent methyltransferase [Nitrospirae bacterium]|nr:class I SAM-dependent methyltransferase [Nitrospirota bacterium]
MRILERLKKFRNRNTKEYWDSVYGSEIESGRIRRNSSILKLVPLLADRKDILDFGCGTCGDVKLLSQHLHGLNFHLLDHSHKAIEFARKQYLHDKDDNGNSFFYYTSLTEVAGMEFDAIISIQVLEHIDDYTSVLDSLWKVLKEGGLLVISVPVKGLRDRHREHVNKFTIKSMFEILAGYSEWVTISPRTYSNRSGILATAFFCIKKESPAGPADRS